MEQQEVSNGSKLAQCGSGGGKGLVPSLKILLQWDLHIIYHSHFPFHTPSLPQCGVTDH